MGLEGSGDASLTDGRLLITGGHVLDPGSGLDMNADVLLEDGRVSRVGRVLPSSMRDVHSLVDVAGMIVTPGLIDLHCHLRDPGFEEKETIETGTKAAARGGFTTVCCMPNTNPPVDSPNVVRDIRDKADREAWVRVLPVGCISVGQGGIELTDMEGLARTGVVGFSDDGRPVVNAQLMREAMQSAHRLDLPILDHCEDPSIGYGGVMNDGILASKLGLKGMPAAAEEMAVARDVELSCLTGARLHIAHVSTVGSVALVRQARRENGQISAEVTPHHLTLTEEQVAGYNTSAKVNPPLRTRKDIEALLEGLSEGIIEVIATDHAPHTAADKAGDFNSAAFGISGLETALAVLLTFLLGRLSLVTLIERLTAGPARVLKARTDRRISPPGLIPEGLGTLRPGAPGDLCIFDPSLEWVVDPSLFVSKGKNNPWKGVPARGKVMVTVLGGRIVYKDESIKTKAVFGGPETGKGDRG
jgi:dihydroorotase